MAYLDRYDFELNDATFQLNPLNPDLCSISSAAPIPILHNSSPSYNHHHQKDLDMEYLAINNRISSYTEFLTTDMEAYGLIPQATSCSSPDSDNYIFGVDDPKIKMEYESLDASSLYNTMSRTLSSESCPELAACNQTTTPLTPIDSPRNRSPIMTPMSNHHQYQQQQQQQQQQSSHMVNEEITSQVMMESTPVTTTKRGRGRRPATSTMNGTTMSTLQIQDPQDFQHSLIGSSSLPSPPQKTTGKSRGRRMTNKPAKPGTKSFECNYAGCGRVFKRSEHLKRHIRSIHTLERPFHCPHPHCSKRFSRSDNLSQHVRVHRPNGKEKSNTRTFSNFTPFLQTYQTGPNLHTTLQQH